MDRDDPTRRPITTHFEDEAFDKQGKADAPPEDEEWHDQPTEEPIDDFADPEQAFAEEQVETNQGTELHSYADEEGPAEDEYSQNVEDEFTEGEPSSARAQAEGYLPRGMKSAGPNPLIKFLPYIAGFVAIAVLGFFGWQIVQPMLSGSATAGGPIPPPPLQQAAPKPETPLPPENIVHTPDSTQQVPPMVENNQPTPLGAAPESLPQQQPPAPQNNVPAAGTVTHGPDYVLGPDGTPQPMPPGGLPPQALGQPPGQQPAAPPPQMQQQAAANAALQSQLAALTQQLEDMKKNQSQLEDQLHQAQAAAQPSADVKAMQDKIASLEQRLNEANAKASAPAPSHKKTSVINKPSNKDEDLAPPVSETVPVKSHKATRRTARNTGGDTEASRLQREMNSRYGITPSQNPYNAMPPQQGPNGMNAGPLPTGPGGPLGMPNGQDNGMPVMAVNAAGGGWILRSAQPGSAWLSQGMSSDLTRVVPGDKVPGLGTIVSVRMVAGRWLVEGTQGSVR